MHDLIIQLPQKKIEQFCKKWKIIELSIFGSALTDDFNPNDSDIDVMYVFADNASWGWEIANMRKELEELFQRPVDFVSKRAIEKSKNPYRKKAILKKHKVIYAQVA